MSKKYNVTYTFQFTYVATEADKTMGNTKSTDIIAKNFKEAIATFQEMYSLVDETKIINIKRRGK